MNAIRDYLLQVGYKIEYPILVNAFKKHLYNPDPNIQGHIRTQFKDYVNRLATVSLENNMKFIILRPEFRPPEQPQPQSPKQPSPQQTQPQLHMQNNHPQLQPQHYQSKQNQHSPRTVDAHQQQQPSAPLDVRDSVFMPPPPPPQSKQHYQHPPNYPPTPIRRPDSQNSLSLRQETKDQSLQMPPPRPPPRRRQSTASLFKQVARPVEKTTEINDLAKKSPGRVKEHALKLNSSFSFSSNLHSPIPTRNSVMIKEHRLSRDSSLGGSLASVVLQRNGSHLTNRSRSSHRDEESDSSSLQPIDPLRRRWAIEACNCNYNGLLTLLREEPRLASYKDIVNGYTALHWAAKFGNLDIIKLIAGTHGVSPNTKSSAGYTPLHVANMFNRREAASLLSEIYKANPDIRDHSGKKAMQYNKENLNMTSLPAIGAK